MGYSIKRVWLCLAFIAVVGSPGPNGAPSSVHMKSPQKVQFVEDLTAILTDTLPDLWKLGHAYFGGQLVLKDQVRITGIQ